MNRYGVALVLSFVGAGLQAGPPSAWAAAGGPDGKALFASKCAACHGKDAKGNAARAMMFKVSTVVPDLTSAATQAKKDEALVAIIRDGRGKMPAQKGRLMGRDFIALVQYVRSLASAKP